jgi:hypothetical protein
VQLPTHFSSGGVGSCTLAAAGIGLDDTIHRQ